MTEIETASERRNTSRESGRETSRLMAEEPDVGLDPITLGSRPEPKADAQPLCHPGAPRVDVLISLFLILEEKLCFSPLSMMLWVFHIWPLLG